MTETYTLKFPITQRTKVHGGSEQEAVIEEVTVRRLKAKDLRVMDGPQGQYAKSLALVGALTGLPIHLVDELDAEDIEAIGGMVGDFLPTRRETGASF